MAQAVTCHCGKKFDATPAEGQRRVNCPTCNSVIFLPEPASDSAGESGYGLAATDEDQQAFRRKRRQGEPGFLQRYRNSRETVKGEQSRVFTAIAGLAGLNATLEPIGAALFLAVSHSDAETSIAALAEVAIARHPVYTPLARILLAHVGPGDATGAQNLVELIVETSDPPARQVLLDALDRIGPTPLVQVRVLLGLLSEPDERLRLWGIRSLEQVGRAAGNAHEPLWELHRQQPPLRLPVLAALATIGRDPARTVDALAPLLVQPDATQRREALRICRLLAGAAQPLVPTLKTLIAKDPDVDLRKVAAEAAASILTAARNQPPAGASPPPGDDLLRVQCPCGKRLQAKGTLAGKTVRCPACAAAITLPSPATTTDPATEESTATNSTTTDSSATFPALSDRPTPPVEKECPRCFATAPGVQVLCLSCGYDFRTGRTVKVAAKPATKPTHPKKPG
ncbi:MAG: HEAT repeat domain-containing protein [Planctomycetaceae bacterium]